LVLALFRESGAVAARAFRHEVPALCQTLAGLVAQAMGQLDGAGDEATPESYQTCRGRLAALDAVMAACQRYVLITT